MATDVACYWGLRGWELKRRAWTHIKGWEEAKKYFDSMSGSWCVCVRWVGVGGVLKCVCVCLSVRGSMCVYACVCACSGSKGRAEKTFSPHLQTAAQFCAAGPCRRWQCQGLPGWRRGVTLLQRNKTQLRGRASDPSTRLHPPTKHGKEEMQSVRLVWEGVTSLFTAASLSRRSKQERYEEVTITARHAA